jgi:uncharacterized protein (DUF1800 family)
MQQVARHLSGWRAVGGFCGRARRLATLEGRVFFFVNKKEAKKTLIPVGYDKDGANTARSGAEVFLLLFFQKKKCLLIFFRHPPVALCYTQTASVLVLTHMNKSEAQAMVRFGLGVGPAGEVDLAAQLKGPDPGLASGAFAALPSGQEAVDIDRADGLVRHQLLTAPDAEKQAYKGLINELYRQDVTAQVNFAIATNQSFRERLVWFWANHFSVSAQNNAQPFIGAMLREAIRPHVTGKFTDMVQAAERHPAMLRFLNNADSVGPNSPAGLRGHRGLNENLGRECMELHTVGVEAGYSQADVTNMAKILTGWGIAPSDKGGDSTGFLYRPDSHEPGAQTVMGHSFSGDLQAGINALHFLSTYPTTYTHIARKLVTHFVADTPPPAAVAHIAGVLKSTDGDLGLATAALLGLLAAKEPGQKLKTPFEYALSIWRAAPPPPDQPAVNVLGTLNNLGQGVWNAPLPNGWPDQASYWTASDAILQRINFAYDYAGRFANAGGPDPLDIAHAALGPLLQPATYQAMQQAGNNRDALTLLFTAPEFMRR